MDALSARRRTRPCALCAEARRVLVGFREGPRPARPRRQTSIGSEVRAGSPGPELISERRKTLAMPDNARSGCPRIGVPAPTHQTRPARLVGRARARGTESGDARPADPRALLRSETGGRRLRSTWLRRTIAGRDDAVSASVGSRTRRAAPRPRVHPGSRSTQLLPRSLPVSVRPENACPTAVLLEWRSDALADAWRSPGGSVRGASRWLPTHRVRRSNHAPHSKLGARSSEKLQERAARVVGRTPGIFQSAQRYETRRLGFTVLNSSFEFLYPCAIQFV